LTRLQTLLSNSTCAATIGSIPEALGNATDLAEIRLSRNKLGRAVQVDPIKPELKARLISALETKMW
jgi:hypothetical protein